MNMKKNNHSIPYSYKLNSDILAKEWSNPPPNSIAENILKAVCNR